MHSELVTFGACAIAVQYLLDVIRVTKLGIARRCVVIVAHVVLVDVRPLDVVDVAARFGTSTRNTQH